MNNDFLTSQTQSYLGLLGDNIRLARTRRQWTQAVLSERSGVNQMTLRQIENGRPAYNMTSLAMVLTALGLEQTLISIAAPSSDVEGMRLDALQPRRRVRASKAATKLDTDF